MAAEGNESGVVNASPVVEFEGKDVVAGTESGGDMKKPENCNGIVHVNVEEEKADEKDAGDGYVLVDCRDSDEAVEGNLSTVVKGVDLKGVKSGVDGESGLRQNSDLIGEEEFGVAEARIVEDQDQNDESCKEYGVDRGAVPDSPAEIEIVVEKEGEAEDSNGVDERAVVEVVIQADGNEHQGSDSSFEVLHEDGKDETIDSSATNAESVPEHALVVEETIGLPPEPSRDEVSCADEGHVEDRSVEVAGYGTIEEQTNAEMVLEVPSKAGELDLGDLSEEQPRSESSSLESNHDGEPSAQGPSGEAGMEFKIESSDANAIHFERFSVDSIDDAESKGEVPCLVDNSELQVEVTNESVDGSQNTISCPLEDVVSEVEVSHLPTEDDTTGHACPENDKGPEPEINEGTVDVDGAETSENIVPSAAGWMDLRNGAELTSTGDDGHASKSHVIAEELEAGKAETLAREGESASTLGEVEVNSDQVQVMPTSSETAAKQEPQSNCEVEARLVEGAVTSTGNHSERECKDNDAPLETCESFPVATKTHHETNREVTFGAEDVICSIEQDKSLDKDEDDKSICKEDNIKEVIVENGVCQSTTEDPSGLVTDLRFYMIRIPRTHDDALTTKIELAQQLLEGRTQGRDSIRMAIQSKKATCDECWRNFDDAKKEERAARKAIAAKIQELNAFYEMTNKIQLANTIDDIDDRMHCLKHRIQHETIPLKEEKQLMREIKELKLEREKHSSKLAPEAEMRKAFEQKDQIDKELKRLTPEMEHLRNELSKAEMKSKAVRKKYDDECLIMKDLQAQHKAADDLRQEAYLHLRNLKKQHYEKNKYFYKYRDDVRAAVTCASTGDKEALRHHCYNQVEEFMDLWNKNDEFRSQYVKSNQNSIIRRFRTLDGRSLGPDEEPSILPNTSSKKLDISTRPLSKGDIAESAEAIDDKAVQPSTPEKDERSSLKVANRSKFDKPKNTSRSNQETAPVVVSRDATELETEESLRKKTEEDELNRIADELARKEEEKRMEIAAAELKEKIRLEQIAKAKEAEERKRRKVEKAKAMAEIRAQKEAEMREKRRQKKKQKESKTVSATDVASGGNRTANEANGAEPVPSSLPEAEEVPESKVSTGSKKPLRAPLALKQQNEKAKPLPPPLRKRGKRKMQTWMWVLLAAVVVLALFFVGNYVSFSKMGSHQHFDF